MLKRSKKKIAKIASLILSAALFIPAMYGMTVKDFVRADDTVAKTTSNTKLGVSQISNPRKPTNQDDAWQGSFVYFGKYDGQPMRYRVLDKNSTIFGGNTMFLDSDKTIYGANFDGDVETGIPGKNIWEGSNLQSVLNGDGFLTMPGVFTSVERDSIAESYIAGHPLSGIEQSAIDKYGNYVGLNGDKVFILDIEDILNEDYGYINSDKESEYSDFYRVRNYDKRRIGDDEYEFSLYWLRNPAGSHEYNGFTTYFVAAVAYGYGSTQGNEAQNYAPAFNVNRDSILFSTAVKGTYGVLGTEYKLTLLDPEMIVLVPDGSVSMDGNKVTFGTKFSGQNVYNVSRVSYMITSKTIGSDGNSILDYGTTHGGNGTGYLTLPNSISGTWGEDYHIYVFAETLNGPYESDYASVPVELVKQQTPDPIDFEGKNLSNTQLGTNGMSSPSVPQTPDDKWNGSYVYFGKYEDIPVKYRVLDKNSTLFSEKQTVFLDCDSTLFYADFDSSSNVWSNSDIREALNGDAFLGKPGVFTATEKSSIVASTVAGHPLTSVNSDAVSEFVNYIGLQNDKIFLLDAEDVLNPEYGYYDAMANDPYGSSAPYHPAYNWYKCELQSPSSFTIWWLRSQDHELDYQAVDLFAGGIFYGIGGLQVNGTSAGVAPAMNIDSNRILFSTAVKGKYGELGTEYKLTLLDPEMIVSVPDNSASMDGGKVTFGYTLSGQRFAERSQISYIVTSKTLGSDGNSILDYGAIHGGNNKGYFTLSNSVSGTWGEDYHIYVFAEKINGPYETDYAGIPVEITAPVPRPKIVSHAIRLSGSIGVKFGVDFPDGTDVSKCYVEFVTSTGRKTTVRTSSAGETDSSRYYIFSINCLEMADEITATLYYDGEAIQTDKYSAMSYIEYLQNHTQDFDSRIIDLVNALHTYGYYMQQSNWSDSVNHTAIPKPSEILTSLDVDRAVTKLNMDTFCDIRKNMGTSGISFDVMVSLTLTSVTTLKIYVKPENSSVIMPRNSTSVNLNGEKYYVFSVSNIGPNHLDTQRRFEIKTNQGTATISLPALFYVKTMLNYGLTTQAQKLALTAYYRYYEAAKALVG